MTQTLHWTKHSSKADRAILHEIRTAFLAGRPSKGIVVQQPDQRARHHLFLPSTGPAGSTCGWRRLDASFAHLPQQFRAKSRSGAPRSMKMGNIPSLERYDVGACDTPP
jgi:hypothetical protein